MLGELPLDLGNQILALLINLVLGFKEGSALMVTQGLDGLDLYLPRQLGLKGQSGCGGAASFPDLAIKLFDFAL